ncbi:hypothetical protein MKX03_009606 [Papaver bracteatum]|nr:hypothetical protein MKX03_009606 [Papaver bracteatum]
MNVNTDGGLKMKFPLIAKPEIVDGSMQSHELSLIVNHGGVMFKVYIVGDYMKCVKRNSLPDISDEQLEVEKNPVLFSQISNKPIQEHNDHMSNEEMRIDNVVMPPDSLVTYIASGLRQDTGLHLMNFDLIRDSRISNHYLVLDINYAPGYENMPYYESVLTDFFCDLRKRKEITD